MPEFCLMGKRFISVSHAAGHAARWSGKNPKHAPAVLDFVERYFDSQPWHVQEDLAKSVSNIATQPAHTVRILNFWYRRLKYGGFAKADRMASDLTEHAEGAKGHLKRTLANIIRAKHAGAVIRFAHRAYAMVDSQTKRQLVRSLIRATGADYRERADALVRLTLRNLPTAKDQNLINDWVELGTKAAFWASGPLAISLVESAYTHTPVENRPDTARLLLMHAGSNQAERLLEVTGKIAKKGDKQARYLMALVLTRAINEAKARHNKELEVRLKLARERIYFGKERK